MVESYIHSGLPPACTWTHPPWPRLILPLGVQFCHLCLPPICPFVGRMISPYSGLFSGHLLEVVRSQFSSGILHIECLLCLFREPIVEEN